MTKLLFGFLFMVWTSAIVHADDLKTVPSLDVNQYMGTWYQIAGNPLFFDKDCVCARQVLTLQSTGDVGVYNSCNKKTVDGKIQDISGTATVVDTTTNAKLEVDFGLPWKGEYWVIGLEPNYNWAVVSDSSKNSLYILARTPTMDPMDYQQAYDTAAAQVDMSNLKTMNQTGCTYPQ